MTDAVGVLICSSSAIIRLCMKVVMEEAITGTHPTRLVAQVAGIAELDYYLAGSKCPDVVVLHDPGDRRLPDVTGAAKVVVAFGEGEGNGAALSRVLRSGVSNVVAIASDLEALPRVCHLASVGLGYMSPTLVRMLTDHLTGVNRDTPAMYGLTPREVQVLHLLAAGRNPKDIAKVLLIESRTVKHNLSSVYRKLGVRSAVEAVVFAYREGLAA